jgi:Flp pilus assembly protein TadG
MTNRMTEIPLDAPLQRLLGKYRAKRSARCEEAQSLVELALMVPLFLLILLGSAEFARFAWAAVLTSSAARAGAAFGARSLMNAGNSDGIKAAAASDGVNLTGLTTTPSTSCACSNGTSIPDCKNSLSYCPAPATIINYVTVNTSSTVTPFGHYPGLPTSFTATAQSTMVVAP